MTTYIESKLNPDGTYDHSEVIEAHENGAKVDYKHPFPERGWENLHKPKFISCFKYRAVIEDKVNMTYEDYLEIKKAMDAKPKIDVLTIPYFENKIKDLLQSKFQSGNAIPVERITLTRAEVNEVFPGLLK